MTGTPRRARVPPMDSLDKEFCNQKSGWILDADAGWLFGSSKFCVDDQGVSIQDSIRVKHVRAPCSEGLQTQHVHTFRV